MQHADVAIYHYQQHKHRYHSLAGISASNIVRQRHLSAIHAIGTAIRLIISATNTCRTTPHITILLRKRISFLK